MDAETARLVVKDFLDWSGGSPPDSEQEIFIYVEYASDCRNDSVEVTRLLHTWLHRLQSG
jgi:hypothetical protein